MFVRLRPEVDSENSGSQVVNGSIPGSASVKRRGSFKSPTSPDVSNYGFTNKSSSKNVVTVLDTQSIRITAPDGAYASRKSVPAVDDKVFRFDHVFDDASNQELIYDRVSQHVRATIKGYNTTIFAFGCTGE